MVVLSAVAHQGTCCPFCSCLGYCAIQNSYKDHRPTHKILARRTLSGFVESANGGCQFCAYALQSYVLFDLTRSNTDLEVDILFYTNLPTELHLANNDRTFNVVEIFPCSDSISPYPELANDVSQLLELNTAIEILNGWYTDCRVEHLECGQRPSTLPKRIVDISQPRYRLIEPSPDTEAVYATLSYSWGAKGFPVTTSETHTGMLAGFDEGMLPTVFREAAAIAKSLKICYLWVDSLCIIQDDLADWEQQAAEMGNIFQASIITIAASLCHDPSESLFKPRISQSEFELCNDRGICCNDIVFKARRRIERGIHNKIGRSREVDHLDTRAWGLQEKLLSTRVLAFTGAEMQWTCRTLKMCECREMLQSTDPLSTLLVRNQDANDALEFSKTWALIVEEYSTRDLTYLIDKLPALGGLAKELQNGSRYTYIAGLWLETIWYDLTWQCDTAMQPRIYVEESQAQDMATVPYQGPTFSWASAADAVNYRLARHSYPGSRVVHASIIDFQPTNAQHDAFGRVHNSFLRIGGSTMEGWLRICPQRPHEYELCLGNDVYSPNADQQAICEFSIDTRFTLSNRFTKPCEGTTSISDHAKNYTGQAVVLISLQSIHRSKKYLYQNFLIARKSPGKEGMYERIGVGSGKVYSKDNVPVQTDYIQPFEWLSIDLRERGRHIEKITAQQICLC